MLNLGTSYQFWLNTAIAVVFVICLGVFALSLIKAISVKTLEQSKKTAIVSFVVLFVLYFISFGWGSGTPVESVPPEEEGVNVLLEETPVAPKIESKKPDVLMKVIENANEDVDIDAEIKAAIDAARKEK